jgi:hypothetical protein
VQLPAVTTDLPHVIQLSVAPVFLLSGVGVTLGVLATRLGRIIDRARLLEQGLVPVSAATHDAAAEELHTLSRRAGLIHVAITLCVASALAVCLLIATLFLGSLLGLSLVAPLAGLFIASMLALIGAYIEFLREIFLATHSLRFGGARGHH